MWRSIVYKATVLPQSQLVWATVYSAAARWSRFPFKIKHKARGWRFRPAKKHCTQSDMWNPKPEEEGVVFFSIGSMESVIGAEDWVWWPIPVVSPTLIPHNFSPHLLPLYFHLQNGSANVRWTMWRRRTAFAKIISESALTWLKAA